MRPEISHSFASINLRRVLIAFLLIGVLGAGFILATRKAGAATVWTVSNGSAGACDLGDPNCATITAAVLASSSGDTINVTAGNYPESNILVNKSLTINGAGAPTTIVDGQQDNRVFDVTSGPVSISGLSIINGLSNSGLSNPEGGFPGENGGGIRNTGSLTINNCVIHANQTGSGGDFVSSPAEPTNAKKRPNLVFGPSGGQGGNGAGIYNGGTLIVMNSTIDGNKTGNGGSGGGFASGGGGGDGGGIWNSGSATVINSTIANNRTGDGGAVGTPPPPPEGPVEQSSPAFFEGATGGSGGEGGGVFNGGSGGLNLRNSTVASNQTGIGGQGGALPVTSPATKTSDPGGHALAPGDGLGGNGGGVYTGTAGTTLTVKSSLIANNSVGAGGIGPDVFSDTPVASQGFNLVGKTDGSSGWVGTDQTGTIAAPLNPLLNALADNGGPTFTMSLQTGSPAVDKGINSFGLPFDQRGTGFPRTSDNTSVGNGSGDATDVGAYEVQTPPGPCNPDVTKPLITCPGSVTKYTDSGQVSANVNVPTPPASDNCQLKSVVGTRSDGKALNAPYPRGVTIITWTATDASNNTSTCTQSIVVMSPGSRKVLP